MSADPFSTPVADPFMDQGSAEAIKFETVGQIHSIIVRRVEQKVDVDMASGLPKTWPNGDPKHVFVFNGEVDGEPRSLWVRGNMVKAIREATVKAGLSTVIDTKVTIKFSELGEATQRGFSPPKLFVAKVEKVAPAVVTEAFPNSQFEDEESF
jgi:hypothetical protein